MGSTASAPASRASCMWRAERRSQLSSSHSLTAVGQASQSQRSASSLEMPSPEKALSARLSVGAAAA